MKIRDYAIGLAGYNPWINEKTFACTAELSDTERKQDLGVFFKPIHDALNHILLTDKSWLQRFRGQPVMMVSPSQEIYAHFDVLRAARRAMEREIAIWAEALTGSFADQSFPFYSVTYRKSRVIPGSGSRSPTCLITGRTIAGRLSSCLNRPGKSLA